ncbi:MAG: methyltransferase domain-containing protein [Streptomycetaceae bacterium]|nr:MAG: methyltransferase domain-containing protein [Streptomycetaceae bacterium]
MEYPKFNRVPASDFHGIPSFVEDEPYVSAFGLQWLKHAKTQLDSHTGLNITRDRLLRMFGPLSADLNGKVILEAGCGAGRFTEILLENSSLITAVDLSVAVLANRENNGQKSNLRIARASITELPFEKEQFDIVFCPGVVQHTPNPSISIAELYKHVKPGGWLVFDQYRYNLSSMLKVTWIARLILKRLTPEHGLAVTDWLVKLWLPAHRRVAGHRLVEILLFRISPITSHYAGYSKMSESDQIAWARLNTHDNLTDFHKHYTTIKSLKRNVSKLGAINQYFCVMPYTIEVRCQKPDGNEKESNLAAPVTIKLRGSKIVSG